MMFFKRKKTEEPVAKIDIATINTDNSSTVYATTCENPPRTITFPATTSKKESTEEWVWVEGYKGLDHNFQGKNNFQYEVGKTYILDGEPSLCSKGFHFCLSLDEVINNYYHFASNNFTTRYCKVKGLVRKSDLENYGTKQPISTNLYGSTFYADLDKLAAKEIIILEEISREYIWDNYIKEYKFNFPITKEIYCNKLLTPDMLLTVIKDILFNTIYDLEITSKEIANLIIDNIATANEKSQLYHFYKQLIILKDLDCGKDMKCYLFFQELNKLESNS